MIKYYASQQADPGTHSLPLQLSNEELMVSSIRVPGYDSTDTMTIQVSVCWEKPAFSDIGQLDLMLRMGESTGKILADEEFTCYTRATSKLTFSFPCHEGDPIVFVLTARSINSRALITGPLMMEVSVSS